MVWPWGGFIVNAVGVAVAVGVAWAPRNNFIMAVIGAGIMAFVATLIADVVFTGLMNLAPRRWLRHIRLSRVAVGAAVGGFVAWRFFLLTDDVAFARAFCMSIPAGVENVQAEGTYISFGDNWILMRFDATPDVFAQITAHRDFRLDTNEEGLIRTIGADGVADVERMRRRTWHQLFQGTGRRLEEVWWDDVRNLDRSEVYRWEGNEHLESTIILWFPDLGRAFVRYIFG